VLPPFHAYVPPPDATSVILVVVQLRTVLLAFILGVGAEKLSVMVILVVASQPFVPVTVKVYVFAAETLKVAFVPTTLDPSNHE
jgi:hypothetical protein